MGIQPAANAPVALLLSLTAKRLHTVAQAFAPSSMRGVPLVAVSPKPRYPERVQHLQGGLWQLVNIRQQMPQQDTTRQIRRHPSDRNEHHFQTDSTTRFAKIPQQQNNRRNRNRRKQQHRRESKCPQCHFHVVLKHFAQLIELRA